MPLYFFNLYTGNNFLPDHRGIVCANERAARATAESMLQSFVQDRASGVVRVKVLDEARQLVFEVTKPPES